MNDVEPTRDEVLLIARLAGLTLLPPYEDELVEAYWHVRRLVRLLPQARAHGNEPAHVFDPARFLPPGA